MIRILLYKTILLRVPTSSCLCKGFDGAAASVPGDCEDMVTNFLIDNHPTGSKTQLRFNTIPSPVFCILYFL